MAGLSLDDQALDDGIVVVRLVNVENLGAFIYRILHQTRYNVTWVAGFFLHSDQWHGIALTIIIA